MPFLRYGIGSYFGDQDCMTEIENVDEDTTRKFYRESTAECIEDSEILVIKRRQFVDELNKFTKIKSFMATLSVQKKSYHKVLINSILNRYNDAAEA